MSKKQHVITPSVLQWVAAVLGAVTAMPLHLAAAGPQLPVRPNIILILTDDQGYGDLSRHQNPVLKTPNMDKLFDESVRFADFCVSPSCAPTRCALMTGMHEFKSGVTHTIMDRNLMDLESTTIADVLRNAGYATGIFGKWHLGHEGSYRPEKRGFDHSLTTINDGHNSHFDPALLRNGTKEKQQGYRTDILFREAIRFIETSKDRPFFCYVPTYSPHAPLRAPQEYVDRYKDKGSEREILFFAMLANIDDNIGKLMAKLSERNLDRNTLVIFMNDNGGTHGVDLWNAGMRGCKGTPWFGGTRAISFWRWHGVLKPKRVDELTGHVDLFPTLAQLAGVRIDQTLKTKLDGISLVPLLTSSKDPWPDRTLFTHMGRWPTGEAQRHKYATCGVRWRNYHLVRSETCDDRKCPGECRVLRRKGGYSKTKGPFHYASTPRGKWALYDTRADPAQEKDLANDNPEIVARMSTSYDQWWDGVSRELD